MKKKYFKYLIVALVIAVLFIARETVFSNMNYFKAKTASDADSHWSETSTTIDFQNSNPNNQNMLFEKHAFILISDNDTIMERDGYGEPIVWKVEKLEINRGFVPLRRNIDFQCEITCNTGRTISKLTGNKMRMIDSKIDATIAISGTTEISGLSSALNDRQQVNEHLAQLTAQKAFDLLRSLDRKYNIQ